MSNEVEFPAELPESITPAELTMLHKALKRMQVLEQVKNAPAELEFVKEHLAEVYPGRTLDPQTGKLS